MEFQQYTPESAIGGLRQLEQYIQRVSVSKQEELIGGTVNIIIVLERTECWNWKSKKEALKEFMKI